MFYLRLKELILIIGFILVNTFSLNIYSQDDLELQGLSIAEQEKLSNAVAEELADFIKNPQNLQTKFEDSVNDNNKWFQESVKECGLNSQAASICVQKKTKKYISRLIIGTFDLSARSTASLAQAAFGSLLFSSIIYFPLMYYMSFDLSLFIKLPITFAAFLAGLLVAVPGADLIDQSLNWFDNRILFNSFVNGDRANFNNALINYQDSNANFDDALNLVKSKFGKKLRDSLSKKGVEFSSDSHFASFWLGLINGIISPEDDLSTANGILEAKERYIAKLTLQKNILEKKHSDSAVLLSTYIDEVEQLAIIKSTEANNEIIKAAAYEFVKARADTDSKILATYNVDKNMFNAGMIDPAIFAVAHLSDLLGVKDNDHIANNLLYALSREDKLLFISILKDAIRAHENGTVLNLTHVTEVGKPLSDNGERLATIKITLTRGEDLVTAKTKVIVPKDKSITTLDVRELAKAANTLSVSLRENEYIDSKRELLESKIREAQRTSDLLDVIIAAASVTGDCRGGHGEVPNSVPSLPGH